MNDLVPYILLGVGVLAFLIWQIEKFLGWEKVYLGWEKVFRKGVIVDGRISAHRCQGDDAENNVNLEQLQSNVNATLLIAQLASDTRLPHIPVGDKPVEYFLLYTYDYHGTNYLHEEKVDFALYHSLKNGDSVKVRFLPEDPMIAQLEK